jgi:hypothetical protein
MVSIEFFDGGASLGVSAWSDAPPSSGKGIRSERRFARAL